ncbi:YggT family protein [Dermatophilus congolensis]|uniref:YGGT family n=1 Tax=Dermatophilus congolensis TaxID=1863 RepID=A0A239VHK0_9MICO|nr:YggT family protein [Dermatophilus congolensis]MBO3128928.1 YggT family protein [Dermatophilus congolensis]MBO3132434.1 YggT family protein [Dermatophilus congolensis]MBO3133405.1 YggT family protein [Dermatophilus congolensis]MBO3135640.1 YggT family protein [Dermatophilus congolensis]MBO3137879.1 YggT family protein [Dermatophilus congolensis]
MQGFFALVAWLLNLYMFVLIARLVIDWIQLLARDWRPKGVILMLCEGVYTVTDPPLKALRKAIPPLRLGAVALDLSFLVLILMISLLVGFFQQLS